MTREARQTPKAIWNGPVPVESDRYEVVEENQYFPPDALRRAYLRDSDKHTVCSWKGTASYFVVVVGKVNDRKFLSLSR